MNTKYSCEFCFYYTNISQNYNNHVKSKKHSNNTEKKNSYECEKCNKKYKSNVGLWKHKKKCNKEEESQTQKSEEEQAMKYFEKNPNFVKEILLNGFKALIKENKIESDNALVIFNKNNEVVPFDEKNIRNEVIEIKNEIIEVNKKMDKLEEKLNYYTDNFCMKNKDYEEFINELVITNKFCKNFSEEFIDPIANLITETLRNYGIENTPIYCMYNKNDNVVIRIKNKVWKSYYYNDAKVAGVFTEIITPLLNKIKEMLENTADDKIKNRNSFKQHFNSLDNEYTQKEILDFGMYNESNKFLWLDERKITGLIKKVREPMTSGIDTE